MLQLKTIRNWFILLTLVIAAGVLHGANWTFSGWWPGAWLGQCLTILIAVLCRPRTAFLAGLAMGCIGIGWAFAWAPEALELTLDASWWGSHGIYGALVLWESAVFGIFCGLTSLFAQHRVMGLAMAPLAWVAAEFWWPRIFPWLLGYSQLDVLPLIQIAEITGPCGVGFGMTAVATLPAAWIVWRRSAEPEVEARRFRQFTGCVCGLLVGWLAFGEIRLSQWQTLIDQAPELKLGVIQVDTAKMGSEAKLRDRTLKISDRVDLICWPESAIGNYSCELCDFTDSQRTQKWSRNSRDSMRPSQGIRCDLLAGGKMYRPGVPEEGPYSMTAYLINPSEQIIGRYFKRTLVPFGEYMPGQQHFPGLREWATLHEIIEEGQDAQPLVTSRGDRIGVVICYEDMLRKNVHATVAAGAEVLFSLINGSAFEHALTLEQHKRLAQMRAVEHRRYFVRCATTGVSCVISPTGKVIAELPVGVEDSMECSVKLFQSKTVYTRWGEYLPWSCTLLLAAGLVVRRRSVRSLKP